MPVVAAFLLGGLLVALVALNRPSMEAPRAVSRFDYHVPADQTFRSTGRPVVALSPDGRHFVYNTERGLYLRSMAALDAQPIRGTETGPGLVDVQVPASPFFAPGGQAIPATVETGANLGCRSAIGSGNKGGLSGLRATGYGTYFLPTVFSRYARMVS